MKNDFFDYLVATDELDEFLGLKDNREEVNEDDCDSLDFYENEDDE